MNQDLDYEPDVLQFKQIWNNSNKPLPNSTNPKNLQTIQTDTKNRPKKISKEPKKQSQNQSKKQHKKSKKRSVQLKKISQKNVSQKKNAEQPQFKPQQVIQISTKPNKFYYSSLENEKNNTVLSHLYLDNKTIHNQNSQGFLANYDLKKSLEQKDYELSLLRVTHSRTEDRVRYLEKQIQKKNQIIAQLRQRQRKIIQKNCDLQSKEFNFDYGKAEYENFRSDSRRLLKMLQATVEYQNFAKLALDDDGVRFLHQVNKQTKSKLDNGQSKNIKSIHFCNCNKEFIPESGFWVPQKVYSFGKQFIKQRQGQMTQAELQLMLYELNKIWREREKRIINTYSAMKAHEVGKYKRKVQNLQARKQQRSSSNNKQRAYLNEQ